MMMPNEYEEAFSAFLEQKEYDGAEQALFEFARAAFYAGWLAAGGAPVQREKTFQVIPGGKA